VVVYGLIHAINPRHHRKIYRRHFFAISVLPLATAVTLNYTAPLFLTVLTLLIFRTRPGFLLLSGIVLGFVGVIFLLQPAMGRELILPALLGLAGGLCGGLAFFSIRELGQRGEPPWRIVFGSIWIPDC
jgi:drug/metabolite transporter (DMT)-like permease